MDKKTKEALKSKGEQLYTIRKQIAELQKEEEQLKNWVMKKLPSDLLIPVKTPDGKKMMGVSDVPQTILKSPEEIKDKIGLKDFLALAKVGVSDLRKYCEERKLKFKKFVKKEDTGSQRVIFS